MKTSMNSKEERFRVFRSKQNLDIESMRKETAWKRKKMKEQNLHDKLKLN